MVFSIEFVLVFITLTVLSESRFNTYRYFPSGVITAKVGPLPTCIVFSTEIVVVERLVSDEVPDKATVVEVEVELCTQSNMVRMKKGYFAENLFYANEWHHSRDSAVNRAKEMQERKISSLKKQLAKLEKMDFDAPQAP